MTIYEIQLSNIQTVQSLLIDAKEECTINNIVYDAGDGVIAAQEVSPSLPMMLSAGKNLIQFTKPIELRHIELLGSGLEFVRAVSVNDSTLFDAQNIAGIYFAQASGTVNGSNKQFISPHPFIAVFINGLPQHETDHFTKINATTFELQDAPVSGDYISVMYVQ